jgi:hypothetical protein
MRVLPNYKNIYIESKENTHSLIGFKESAIPFFIYTSPLLLISLTLLNKYFPKLNFNIVHILVIFQIYLYLVLVTSIYKISFLQDSMEYREFFLFFPIHFFSLSINHIHSNDSTPIIFINNHLYYFISNTGLKNDFYKQQLSFFYNSKVYNIGNNNTILPIINFIDSHSKPISIVSKIS